MIDYHLATWSIFWCWWRKHSRGKVAIWRGRNVQVVLSAELGEHDQDSLDLEA